MKISSLTQSPYYSARHVPSFGQDDKPQAPVRHPLSLGLTVLQDPPNHDHQPGGPGVKPCCAGKQKPAGLSLTVLNDTPDPSRPQNAGGNALTVLTPQPHKPGGSCCGGHKPNDGDEPLNRPAQPLTKPTGGSCCSTQNGDHAGHLQPVVAKPTTLAGKLVHAVKSVFVWFGHFFGSFWADMRLLVSGKTS